MPHDGEGGDGTRARAGDGAIIRAGGEIIIFREGREQFVDDHAGILVVEGVVFLGPVGGAVAPVGRTRDRLRGRAAGVDEDREGDGQFAAADRIVEDVGHGVIALGAGEGLAVLEDRERGGRVTIVLGGDVAAVVVERAVLSLAWQLRPRRERAARDVGLRLGVGAEFLDIIERRGFDGTGEKNNGG